jgi:hypothetical protein
MLMLVFFCGSTANYESTNKNLKSSKFLSLVLNNRLRPIQDYFKGWTFTVFDMYFLNEGDAYLRSNLLSLSWNAPFS